MTTPFQKARDAFDQYAGVDHPALPDWPGSALQVAMYRWTAERVPKHTLPGEVEGGLGLNEELGELEEALAGLRIAAGRLSHVLLNASQGRRGYATGDVATLREKVADALADGQVFAMAVATSMRLDFWTLVSETAKEVMEKRDWKVNPQGGQP